MVCLIEKEEGALIFDDTILEKAWTDKSELMCWHYDHVSGRSAKGVNFLNALHHVGEHLIAVAFERVIKSIEYCDTKIRQIKRMSTITKNEQMRQMMGARIQNEFKFGFVLINSWFCAEENFEFIPDRGKHFIAALKDNGRVALSEEDRKGKRLVREDELHFAQQGVVKGYLKGYDKAVSVVRQVFTHKDGSTALLHLVCSDLTCDYDAITTTYKKRWQVEVFHKSLKFNARLAKSPTRTLRTQSNHVFMSICATFKLQCLSIKS